MGLLKLLFGNSEKKSEIESIEDDLYFLYGYSKKEIKTLSDEEKKDLWLIEEENEYEEY